MRLDERQDLSAYSAARQEIARGSLVHRCLEISIFLAPNHAVLALKNGTYEYSILFYLLPARSWPSCPLWPKHSKLLPLPI